MILVAASTASALSISMQSATAAACAVENTRTRITYVNLAEAVRAAGQRDTLTVRGACLGPVEIPVSLRLVGGAIAGEPMATISGDASGPVLSVADHTRLLVRDILVANGAGGIWSRFNGTGTTVVLRGSSTVSSNPTASGRGIRAQTVRLGGRATVAGNETTGDGGGILATDVYVSGNAVVRDNTASGWGGGIRADTVELRGNAEVSGNTSEGGGGISALRVTLNDSAFVAGNHVVWGGRERMLFPLHGGGIAAGFVSLHDQAAVTGNDIGVVIGDEGPEGGYGGGVWAKTFVRMTGSSTVDDNEASRDGGGLFTLGRIVMRDDSSLTGNGAGWGGGIFAERGAYTVDPKVTLYDRASVTGNHAYYEWPSIFSAGAVYVCSDEVTISPDPPLTLSCT